LKIRAARFADASGAFGAYLFYVQPAMAREDIGDQGASAEPRVLFYRGHILVEAVFSKVSLMSPANLRELAGLLPRPAGNAGNLPPILAFMPHHGYEANTEKYAEGPLGLGAIGIINIMLVSVTERTKEIGLRKALGATYRAILTQFFIEGAFLTAFSGGIGLVIATGFVTLLAMLPSPEGFDTPRIIPASALAAIGSLAIAGIAAGLYPARKAALLPPVEALRQE